MMVIDPELRATANELINSTAFLKPELDKQQLANAGGRDRSNSNREKLLSLYNSGASTPEVVTKKVSRTPIEKPVADL